MTATIIIIPPSPTFGSTVNTAVVTFTYQIADASLGVGNIEYSIDGGNTFHSILEGQRNQALADSTFFPLNGTFDIELSHGSYVLQFRIVDRLNDIGPITLWNLIVDISTTITINPISSFTSNPTLILTGTREAGAIVTITRNFSPIAGVSYPTVTTWQVTIILQEGNNTIVATATDIELNSATATATIILDTIAPANPTIIQINPAEPNYIEVGGTVFTNQSNEVIVGNKESNTAVYLNNIEMVAFDNSTTFSIPIVLSEGSNSFVLKTKDQANNFSEEIALLIVLDTISPQTPSIVINGGIDFTLNRNVTLTLAASGDPVKVKYSEDINFTNIDFIAFTGPSMSVPFELSHGGGTKTVYAVFSDAVGNETVPVFDSIILPSTTSQEVERAAVMTIQHLAVTPEDEYLIKLQDNRDGTFSIGIYVQLIDAVNEVNRKGSTTSTITGQQTLTLTPDLGGIDPGGTITLTLIEGAETIIYRFRTDVLDPTIEDANVPIIYSLKETKEFCDAQILIPFYEGSALGQIIEYNVDGDPRKLRISKSFLLYDENTAIVDNIYYPTTDLDGNLFPINAAKFSYPLMSSSALILTFEEEATSYLITIDKDFTRFNPVFGYEILFTKKRKKVTDYRIFKDGKVDFLDESRTASGNVRISYNSPQFIVSEPSPEFKTIYASPGANVSLTVEPTNNLILLSELDKIKIRFFHSLKDPSRTAPLSIQIMVNDTFLASTGTPAIINDNTRAQIWEFSLDADTIFFPTLITDTTFSVNNPILQKVVISFVVTTPTTFIDEIQVLTKTATISSNCRVIVNGQEKFLDSNKVSRQFDVYEMRVQPPIVDVVVNDKIVYTQDLDLNGSTASLGAGARVNGDNVNAAFNDFTTIEYLDASPTSLVLSGRFIEIESNLRKDGQPLLQSFGVNFSSANSEYPPRLFTPNIITGNFFDTATVAIIGIGHREEVLVKQGLGKEDEGQPIDFNPNNTPDGRHFKVTSFPIILNTLRVFLTHNGIERLLQEEADYHTNLNNGYVVLFHPIALGDILRTTYTSSADSNIPEIFTDINKVIVKFGTPSIENTLSLGALLAFENGAKRVLAVQALDPTIDINWTQAYESLTKEEAYFVVPIPPNNYALIAGSGLVHVENQSGVKQRHERVLILGEANGLTGDDLSLFRNSFRVVFLQPQNLSRVISGETIPLDGRFLAAAYAGKFSSLNLISEPMTGKEVVGFTIDEHQRYTNIQLEDIAKQGITILRPLTSGGKVYRSTTTSASNLPVEQEQSIVRIRDFLAINIRKTLEERFVGQTIATTEILDHIAKQTREFLEIQVAQRLISRYTNTRIKIDDIEPRQVNVSFDVEPIFPLNNIILTVNVVTKI